MCKIFNDSYYYCIYYTTVVIHVCAMLDFYNFLLLEVLCIIKKDRTYIIEFLLLFVSESGIGLDKKNSGGDLSYNFLYFPNLKMS